MKLSSLCVGVCEYEKSAYNSSEMRLRYSVDDANAFSRYAALADGSDQDKSDRHVVLANLEATFENMNAVVERFASLGSVDLFILYLSGHGEVSGVDAGWFCLADADPGRPSLTGPAIDNLLSKVSADHVLVVLDCCFAEAVLRGAPSLLSLGQSHSRVAVASARGNQRSWEDDNLRRSIFSDVLLRALSTNSSIADTRGFVAVEAALLPHLRLQVPLTAMARKRGVLQEPVSFGAVAQGIMLPTVSSVSFGRTVSASEAIRSGVRRVLMGLALTVFAALIFLEALIFHIAVDGSGEIVIRPGLSWSFAILPFHISETLETGFRLSDFDQRKDDVFKRLAAERDMGVRTHLDGDGIRTWLASLEPGLLTTKQASVTAFARGVLPKLDPNDAEAPTDETRFLSRLLRRTTAAVAADVYPRPLEINLDCSKPVASNMDFTLFSSDSGVFRRDAQWIAATAPSGAKERSVSTEAMVKWAAYRSYQRKTPDERGDEFAAFAKSVAILVDQVEDLDTKLSLTATLRSMSGTWCAVHAAFVRALIDREHDAEAELWSALELAPDDDPNGRPVFLQASVSEALAQLSARRPLQKEKLEWLGNELNAGNIDLSLDVPLVNLLRRSAALQPLPETLVNAFLAKLRPPKDEFDFDPLIAARFLACNALFLNDAHRAIIRVWLSRNADSNRTMSDLHEALGCASAVWPLESSQIALLVSQLSPASRFPPKFTNYRGETIIFAGADRATIAIGRMAQRFPITEDLARQLATFSAGRTDLQDREAILLGLGHRWYGDQPITAEDIYIRLRSKISDSALRKVEEDVATAMIVSLKLAQQRSVIEGLLRCWRTEDDPALRLSIGHVVGAAP